VGLSVQYAETFEITFKALIDFLRENWGDKVVTHFVEETEKVIDLITNFPRMYKASSFDQNVRVAPINKLSSLFYEVTNKHITLLHIIDTRQEPFWL